MVAARGRGWWAWEKWISFFRCLFPKISICLILKKKYYEKRYKDHQQVKGEKLYIVKTKDDEKIFDKIQPLS